MSRRELLLTVPAAIAFVAVGPALPQQAMRAGSHRIGYLASTPLSDPAAKRIWTAFLEGLREYGWIEGQNLLIEGRWVEGQTGRYGPLRRRARLPRRHRADSCPRHAGDD